MGVFTKVALALLLCIAAASYIVFAHAADYFAAVLKSAHESEIVVINAVSYRVVEGEVYRDGTLIEGESRLPALRLAYEKVIARHSPILGLAGTDPDALTRAVSALASSSAQLATLQDSPLKARVVEHSLFPLTFLRALADLERARLAFLQSGDARDEAAYDRTLRQALDAYRNDLADFSDAFRTNVPLQTPPYATEYAVLTRADMIAALDQLGQEAHKTAWRERKRSLCVGGLTIFCEASDLALSGPAPASADPGGTDLSTRTLGLFHAAGSIPNTSNPPVMLQNSDCIKDDKAPIFYMSEHAASIEYFLYVGDLRFVRTAEASGTPLYAAFAARGITYAPLQPSSYYECFAAAADAARTEATLATARFAHDAHISQFAQGPEQAALMRLEAKLTARPVRESDALDYLNRARDLSRDALPASTTAMLATLTLSFHDRSADFDEFVASIAAGETLNVKRAAAGINRSNDAGTLLYTRSAFTSLFLSQNPSIVAVPFTFRQNTEPRTTQPFVWLSQLPPSMDPELRQGIIGFREVSQP